MLYAGGREVKQVWCGGRPAAQVWCGGRMAWGSSPAPVPGRLSCMVFGSKNGTGVAVQLSNVNNYSGVADGDVEWSGDGSSWQGLSSGTWARSDGQISVRAATRLQGLGDPNSENSYRCIALSGDQISAAGPIVALIDPALSTTVSEQSNAFKSTFESNQSLVDVSEVEVKWGAEHFNAFTKVFYDCRSLTAVVKPENFDLSVKVDGGYHAWLIYENCRSLSSACFRLPWAYGTQWDSNSLNGGRTFCNTAGLDMALTDLSVVSHFGDGNWQGAVPSLDGAPYKTMEDAASNCGRLSSVYTDFTSFPPDRGFGGNWLNYCASSGTLRCPTALGTDATIARGNGYCPTGWTVVNY